MDNTRAGEVAVTFLTRLMVALTVCIAIRAHAVFVYVDPNSSHPTPPYANWETAATSIQEAIDAASAGDTVLVANGVYASGGKVIAGDLTNRVALDKPLTVQSINGPCFTTIRGDGATNGTTAVRCAWLTNGAVLKGFTLTAGATRAYGDITQLRSGGGALCASSNAILSNCLIISNTAHAFGGGICQGSVQNSFFGGNRTISGGSAAAGALLLNCSAVSNLTSRAFYYCRAANCIDYYNLGTDPYSSYSYSCSFPLPSGDGNLTNAPEFLDDLIHLARTSPCRARGTNIAIGSDIDGHPWDNPPSIGCDEWSPRLVQVGQPVIRFDRDPTSFAVGIFAVGEEPFTCHWTRNGFEVSDGTNFSYSRTTNLIVHGIDPAEAGVFQVVVRNFLGSVTSRVAQLTVRYVNATNSSPQPPYLSWATAATNIQNAIDTSVAGDVVLVTNGTYATGGKNATGGTRNVRMVIDKAIRVQSSNGPWETTVLGGGVFSGINPERCAWLADGASLVGFTLMGGKDDGAQGGGGVWCASSNAFVSNCHIKSNTASSKGAGIYQGTINNSLIAGNVAGYLSDGAVHDAHLINCSIVSNQAIGAISSVLTNCIAHFNRSANYQARFKNVCSG